METFCRACKEIGFDLAFACKLEKIMAGQGEGCAKFDDAFVELLQLLFDAGVLGQCLGKVGHFGTGRCLCCLGADLKRGIDKGNHLLDILFE